MISSVIDELFNASPYPFIIAGPCSAESPEQLIGTAMALKQFPEVKLFRTGIWKARTRPDAYQGPGEEGLKWLHQAKEASGLPTAVEVAHKTHVEQALKYGIDVIWIGARTVVNPFSMQEISDAIKGVDIPVMIKNPVTPDIDLWTGAIERLLKAGNKNIIAIHRGFYPAYQSKYRNIPMWEIPIELKRRFPEIHLICDPSHISGNRSLVFEIAQKALDLEMNGLMLEVHPNPQMALSDARQQITPAELRSLLDKLTLRSKIVNEKKDSLAVLALYRTQIDSIDQELLELLAQRFEKVKKIAALKKKHNITILQLDRWRELMEVRLQMAENIGLEKNAIEQLWTRIHQQAIDIQNQIMNDEDYDKENP